MEATNNKLIQELVLKIQKAEGPMKDLLLNDLAAAMEKFTWSTISKYRGKYDKDDLYQVAWVGIMDAIRTYNPDKGAVFTTHAYWLIMRELRVYIIGQNKHTTKADDEGNTIYSVTSLEKEIEGTEKVTYKDSLESDEDVAWSALCNCYSPQLHEIANSYTNKRQRTALNLLLKGYRPVEIAEILNISSSYISDIKRKYIKKCKKALNIN